MEKSMEKISIYDLIVAFNKSELRKRMIPQELASGWPSIRKLGRTLCITIPYYGQRRQQDRVLLYPPFCSVTVPVGNPDRIMDFTIYPYQKEWKDVDYEKPSGIFKHKALEDITTRGEYEKLCRELYGCFDDMVDAVRKGRPFDGEREKEMIRLFTKLMEPGEFPCYLWINKKFYAHFCRF